jgi:hypothetical protein
MLKTDFLVGRNNSRRFTIDIRLNHRFVQQFLRRAEEITKQQTIQQFPALEIVSETII